MQARSQLLYAYNMQQKHQKKSPIWYPQFTFCNYSQLYDSIGTSDVTFKASSKEFYLHKCVLCNQAKALYELALMEEKLLSSSNNNNNNCVVALPNINEITFLYLVRFIYDSKDLPRLFRWKGKNKCNIAKKDATLILVAAD